MFDQQVFPGHLLCTRPGSRPREKGPRRTDTRACAPGLVPVGRDGHKPHKRSDQGSHGVRSTEKSEACHCPRAASLRGQRPRVSAAPAFQTVAFFFFFFVIKKNQTWSDSSSGPELLLLPCHSPLNTVSPLNFEPNFSPWNSSSREGTKAPKALPRGRGSPLSLLIASDGHPLPWWLGLLAQICVFGKMIQGHFSLQEEGSVTAPA